MALTPSLVSLAFSSLTASAMSSCSVRFSSTLREVSSDSSVTFAPLTNEIFASTLPSAVRARRSEAKWMIAWWLSTRRICG